MTEFYQVQASVTGQGMEIRLEMIQERANDKLQAYPQIYYKEQ